MVQQDPEYWTALKAKVDTMSNEEREARVQDIYAMESPSEDVVNEFFSIMFGDTSSENKGSKPSIDPGVDR